MATYRLPDYPSLLKQHDILLSRLFKIEAMVEILMAKDLADGLNAKHLYEYVGIMGDLLGEARVCSEHIISQLIKFVSANDPMEPEA